jgi:hypothetical protein
MTNNDITALTHDAHAKLRDISNLLEDMTDDIATELLEGVPDDEDLHDKVAGMVALELFCKFTGVEEWVAADRPQDTKWDRLRALLEEMTD